MSLIYGGIEAGGTKWVCAVYDPARGSGAAGLCAKRRFPNTTPAETLPQAVAFFQEQATRLGRLSAVGVGCFGPLDPEPSSPTFGYVTTTPKPGWAGTDVAGPIARALGVPVGFDTDVNAAALGEASWGAAQGLDTFIYLTVGTGIGGGGLANGRLMHGLLHPEMGHIRFPRDQQADPFPGICPYHGDCLEGLACGPAIEARWQQRGETLPVDHPAWELEANYLALALANFICTLSPQRIVLGGGVMEQVQLFPLIRTRVQQLLNGYLQVSALNSAIDSYIVPAGLGSRAGVLGAVALGLRAAGQPLNQPAP
jgi:fructokinase